MEEMEKLKEELFSLLKAEGAVLMGIADLSGIVSGAMKTGVSVAVPVPKTIVRDLQTAPTKEYYEAYHSLNAKLNKIVTCGAEFLKGKGYQAMANTTDAVVMNEEWRTPLPHKTAATRAGLDREKLPACDRNVWECCAPVYPADRCPASLRHARNGKPLRRLHGLREPVSSPCPDRCALESEGGAGGDSSAEGLQGHAGAEDERGYRH